MKKYEDSATRLEHRGTAPPTREYVNKLVESLLASGVEASWHSAVDPLSRALFPSRVFPNCHPQANFESFHYLISRLHEIGRPVISWYSLNHSAGVLEAHPEWKMEFYEVEGQASNPQHAQYYCCYNSPYGELLPKFAVEVVRDVGFDGIWFDGSTFSNHSTRPLFQPGCKCRFCQERYFKDTGRQLPLRIDWQDKNFRLWVNWRYDILMQLWQKIVKAVTEIKPEAIICFNNYRRRTYHKFTWNTAIPLRKINLDALMGSELDMFPGQADIQMKINQAYRCFRGVETWWPLGDNCWVPDMESLTAVQAALGCLSAGGIASCGVGIEPENVVYILKQMEETVSARMEYLGGKRIEYAGIVASQKTMDFWAQDNPNLVWDEIHGANELLNHCHLQPSVIFDDYLTAKQLKEYPVVILGNAVCLSKDNAEELTNYVSEGGILFACGQAGKLDDLGYPHKEPVLDKLLGIQKRQPVPEKWIDNRVSLLFLDEKLKEDDCPYLTLRGMEEFVFPKENVNLLAKIREFPSARSPLDKALPTWPEEAEKFAGGLWIKQVEKSFVIYTPLQIFTTYLKFPATRAVRIFKKLFTSLVTPAITLAGPLAVRVNTRILPDGKWAVHLHNNPGSAYLYPAPPYSNGLRFPGEVSPAYDLKIFVHRRKVKSACSGLTGKFFKVSNNQVEISELKLHEVVLLETN